MSKDHEFPLQLLILCEILSFLVKLSFYSSGLAIFITNTKLFGFLLLVGHSEINGLVKSHQLDIMLRIVEQLRVNEESG